MGKLKGFGKKSGWLAGLLLAGGLSGTLAWAAGEGMMGKMLGMAQEQGLAPVAVFNGAGELTLPEDYREWVFVGAPVTPNDLNGGKAAFPEFHNVYIDPASYQEYRKTGKFRDGTMLLKERVSVGAMQAVSGKGYFQGNFLGLEAAVKDSGRFSKEPGYWAYFSFTEAEGAAPKATAKAFPAADCNACHQGNAKEDWVFTQYYPVLRAARGK